MRPIRFLILVVDDDENDQLLITRAFRSAGVTQEIRCVNSGNEAIAYLEGRGEYADRNKYPYPSFILTDLKMPDGDGFAVLDFLRSHSEWAVIPTVVFSSSADNEDVLLAYKLGASCFLCKPDSPEKLREMMKCLYTFWNYCEIPIVDSTGRRIEGTGCGKLGKRFFIGEEFNDTPATATA